MIKHANTTRGRDETTFFSKHTSNTNRPTLDFQLMLNRAEQSWCHGFPGNTNVIRTST